MSITTKSLTSVNVSDYCPLPIAVFPDDCLFKLTIKDTYKERIDCIEHLIKDIQFRISSLEIQIYNIEHYLKNQTTNETAT